MPAIRGRFGVPEKVVQQHVVTFLRSIGAKVWVLGTKRPRGDYQGTRQTPGIADVFCVLPKPIVPPVDPLLLPRSLWVECKADGGRLSPDQLVFQAACVDANEVGHVVGGLGDVVTYLIEGGWVRPDQVSSDKLGSR